MLSEPPTSADCGVRSWGEVFIPGKAVPQSADVGCICQVNEKFIRVTVEYSVL